MMDPGTGVALSDFNVDAAADLMPTHQLDRTIKAFASNLEEAVKEEQEEAPEKEDSKSAGKYVWGDTPTFDDQYTKYPDLCRLVGPEVAIFDIINTAELDKLNTMLKKQNPQSAPAIVLANKKENFHEGKWYVLLEYYRVEYKTVLTTS